MAENTVLRMQHMPGMKDTKLQLNIVFPAILKPYWLYDFVLLIHILIVKKNHKENLL